MKLFRQQSYKFLMVVTLLIFGLKALIPAGFMPEFDADGKATLVVCTAQGTKLVEVDADILPPSDTHSNMQMDHDTCPYAPLLAEATNLNIPALSAVAIAANNQYVYYNTVSRDLAATYNWKSRAPPTLIQL